MIVGVNGYVDGAPTDIELLEIDPTLEEAQVTRVRAARINRDQPDVDALLVAVGAAASTSANMLYPMKAALSAGATVGEISDVLRAEFGTYRPH